MRRLLIAFLAALEAAVGCAIFATSLQLSDDIQRSPAVGRVTHAVVRRAEVIASVFTKHIHRLT
jgi:hypothetical protein